MWVIDPGPHRRKELWVRVLDAAETRWKKGHTPQGPVGKGRREWEEGLSAQRTLGKGCRKVLWQWRGRVPGCGEGTRTHRRALWVVAPHPVRPLSHTHPPRGALLGLATVRGLAVAAAAPQQWGLLFWLPLQWCPRPSASVARPARAPGRCSGARAASARDGGKMWDRS